MSCVMGEEIGESLDINKLIQGEIKISQNIAFTISTQEQPEEEYKKIMQNLETFINERGIYGSYGVKIVNEMNAEEILYEEYFYGGRGEKK